MNQFKTLPLTCPCCAKVFDSFQLRHPLKSDIQYTDFFQAFHGAQPLNYSIHTCPHCGFSGQEKEFKQKDLNEDLKKKIKAKLMPLMSQHNVFSGQQYEYAAMIAQWSGDAELRIAKLHLKAAWCYRNARGREGEKKCLKNAITSYTQAYNNKEIPDSDKSQYMYLIGELHRRIGELAKAADWFEKAKDYALSEKDHKWVAELALQQKTDPKDYIQREKPYMERLLSDF
ncbi:MAG: DUF2225 domain-containing protein [Spirochaetales bacterium]|nr:DUF2225 domain-containing protein [Spirochaetales bacterium]